MKNSKTISKALLGAMLLSIIAITPILPYPFPPYPTAPSKGQVLLEWGIAAAVLAGLFWLSRHAQTNAQNPWHAILPEQRRVLRSELQNIQTGRATLADVLGRVNQDAWYQDFLVPHPNLLAILNGLANGDQTPEAVRARIADLLQQLA
ncbi:MAG TPA: hypothetical protein VJ201_08130 [Candidatus Babeliales bacterium]|nr:hypothetical protein [Candidatus Babeliales bacterium]